MLRTMLKSKIHRATVTGADLSYEGSISIDKNLMQSADIVENEKVAVLNVNNGARFETYAIPSDKMGEICLNGAAARLVQEGDIVIIVTYCELNEAEVNLHKPKVIKVNEINRNLADLLKD